MYMIDKLKDLLGIGSWILVESHTAVWNLTHGVLGTVQDFVFYKLEFNPRRNKYRLNWEGKSGDKHVLYGEMLARLADLNAGEMPSSSYTPYEDDLSDIFSKEGISVVKMDISEDSEKAWQAAVDDPELIKSIENHKKILLKKGIEIFDQKFNVLATDQGYFLAIWNKDISFTEEKNTDEDTEEND